MDIIINYFGKMLIFIILNPLCHLPFDFVYIAESRESKMSLLTLWYFWYDRLLDPLGMTGY